MRDLFPYLFSLFACISTLWATASYAQDIQLPKRYHKRVKIGLSLPLSGSQAEVGAEVQLMVQFIAKELAPEKYEFVTADDKCTEWGGVSAMHQLLNVHKVRYVLGPICNETMQGAIDLISKAGVTAITPTASLPPSGNPAGAVLQTWPRDNIGLELMHKYVNSKYRVLGIISEEGTRAKETVETLLNFNKSHKLKMYNIWHPTGDTEFDTVRSKLVALTKRKVDVLLINSNSLDTFGKVYRRMLQSFFRKPVLAVFYPARPEFLKYFKEKADGIVFVDPPRLNDIVTEQGKEWHTEFKAAYPAKTTAPDFLFATTIEAFRTLHLGIQQELTNPDFPIRDYLHSATFKGIIGKYTFDESGIIEGVYPVLKTIQRGKVIAFRPGNHET